MVAAEAAVLRTTELRASPATAAAMNPRRSRVVLMNFVTGSLLVMVVGGVALVDPVDQFAAICRVGPLPGFP